MKKKLATIILTTSILTASLAAPFTVQADELTNQIQQQEEKLNNLNNQLGSTEAVLATVQAEIAEAETQLNDLLAQRVETQDGITALGEEIAQLQIIIDQREEQLAEQARSVQVTGSNTNYLNFVFASDSLTDLISRIDVVTTMMSANKELVEKQISDQELVAEKKATAEEQLSEIISMTAEMDTLKASLAVKVIEQESAMAALNAEKATVEEDRQMYIAQKEEADRLAAEEEARQVAIAAERAERIAAEEEAARQAAETVAIVQTASIETETTAVEAATRTETVVNNPAPISTPAPTPAPAPTPSPAPSAPAASIPPAAPSGDLISTAYKYIGVPYKWGGRTPAGFDCSGFTSYVFREAYGMEIGGWTGAQENLGPKIGIYEAQAGDLLFWGNAGNTYHVAISLGGDQYIHAPDVGSTVEVRNFSWFKPQFAVRVAR